MLGNGMGDSGQIERFGCNGLDSSQTEGLMFDSGPPAAAIMAIKRPLSDKERRKSNRILANAHMLPVILLHLNNLMSF